MTVDIFAHIVNDAPWQKDAACAQSHVGDLFFPEAALWESEMIGRNGSSSSANRQTVAAITICNTKCPVRRECGEYADLIDARDGIWAGRDRGKKLVNQNSGKTHCPSGHAYDEANTRHSKNGARHCRACDQAAVRTRRNNKLERVA